MKNKSLFVLFSLVVSSSVAFADTIKVNSLDSLYANLGGAPSYYYGALEYPVLKTRKCILNWKDSFPIRFHDYTGAEQVKFLHNVEVMVKGAEKPESFMPGERDSVDENSNAQLMQFVTGNCF